MIIDELPRPAHELGYTPAELDTIFIGDEERAAFADWMRGQTGAIGPDGAFLTYEWDVKRYIRALRTGVPAVFD